jgi:hypothetical protein
VCEPSFWIGTFGSHLFYTDVVVYLLEEHTDILCRNIARQMPDNGFSRFIRLSVKCEEVEIFSQRGMYTLLFWFRVQCSGRTPCPQNFSSLWRQLILASDINTMGGGLLWSMLSFVPGGLVEFCSLPASTFSLRKSLSGAKYLFVTTGHRFWQVAGGLFSFLVQHSSSEFLSLLRHLFSSASETSSCPGSMLLSWRLSSLLHVREINQ